MSRPQSRTILNVLRWIAVAACVGIFVHALASADLGAAWHRIRSIGPIALLVLVPFPIGLAFDAAAWSRLLAALGRKVRVRTLFRIRLATEALVNSLPVGAVWAEALAPVLVARRSDASVADAFASSTAKRWTIVRVHACYVTLALALGIDRVTHASERMLGSAYVLPMIVAGGALGLAILAFGIEWLATRGTVVERVSSVVGNARFLKLTSWIEKRRSQLQHADAQLRKLGDDTKAARAAALRIAITWLMEGVETYVILRLLGADLGWIDVISFDAALSVVRSAAVFAPAGIGVQDVGYMRVLEAYDVPDAGAIGPAFVVIKRAKELFWIAVGYAVLTRLGVKRRQLAHAASAAT